MKIPAIFSNIGKRTVNLVRRTNIPNATGLTNDVAEISTKTRGIKKLLIGVDKKMIIEWEKLPFEDFLEKSQNIITKSLNIPEELCPPIKIQNLSDEMAMQYALNHTLIVNKQYKNLPKALLFSFVRHEMKHCEQNLVVLRTENLGENAVNEFSSKIARVQANFIIKHYREMPIDEIQKLRTEKKMPEAGLSLIEKLRQVPSDDKQSIKPFFDAFYNNKFKIHHNALSDIRTKAIARYGVIKENTPEAIKANKYYKGFCKTCEDNSGLKYWTSKHEMEAYGVTFSSLKEYLFKKFFG